MRRMWMAVLVVVTGCDGIDLERLVRQHPPLSRLEAEPAGTHCAHGGHAVHTGLDRNDNGVLDDDEVVTTAYACATAIPGVLVHVQDEPPGENCTEGGKVYRAGHDLNGNDTLEDSEVSREVYGCASSEQVVTRVRAHEPLVFPCHDGGSRVEAGQDQNGNGELDDSEVRATATLCVPPTEVRVRQSPAPAGLACPTPSIQVDVGTDADGDDVLEDEEVSSSMFVCQPLRTLDGNHHVRSAMDLVVLEGISRIRGNLYFEPGPTTEAVLPDLMQVEGALEIRGTSLQRVELPSLRSVGHAVHVIDNAALTTLWLGAGGRTPLWVQGEFTLASNPLLPTLEGVSAVLPRNNLTLRDNDAIEVGYFAHIAEHLGSITVEGNEKLPMLPFRHLAWVGGSVSIIQNPTLSSLEGTVLQKVVGDLIIEDNDALTTLSGMPILEAIGGTLGVRDNDHLASVEGMDALAQVGELELSRNPQLESAGEFPALAHVTSGIYLNQNAKLKSTWGLGKLQHMGFLYVGHNPELTGLMGFDRLHTLGTLTVEGNTALPDLTGLVMLRAVKELHVLSNENLLHLNLEALENVSVSFSIVDNPRLPNCLAVQLAERVNSSGTPEIHGNDTTATCD
ncbi:DUF7151 family protein [Myxococcus sp. Y35]|uniref:DUF7151 family protein n=1 Tax=Pseudomyxococcus flavus TaxID=3115648 RepID=UPI003CF855BF